MAQTAIFGPFFATLVLTLLVWVYMYIRRISFITKNNISPKDLALPGALAQLSPAAVSNPSDNLKLDFSHLSQTGWIAHRPSSQREAISRWLHTPLSDLGEEAPSSAAKGLLRVF
jgi:hypothetical protein